METGAEELRVTPCISLVSKVTSQGIKDTYDCQAQLLSKGLSGGEIGRAASFLKASGLVGDESLVTAKTAVVEPASV